MNQKQNTTRWKDKPTAEKLGSLAGWAVIIAILGYWLTPAQTPPPEPPSQINSEAPAPATAHTLASPQALIDATEYLTQLDQAMAQGVHILNANSLPELMTHSQVFKALLEAGRVQFGSTVFEPLGHCGVAGLFANSWWQAQLSTTRQGGAETVPGAIQNNLDEYTISRAECLKQADPRQP